MQTGRAGWFTSAALAILVTLAAPSEAQAEKTKKVKKASTTVPQVIARVNGEDVTKSEFAAILKANGRFFDLAQPKVRERLAGKKLDEYLFEEEILKIRAMARAHAAALPEMKKIIDEAARRVEAGEDFAEVAKELSQEPAPAARGGDLGELQGFFDLVHPFNRVAHSMKEGEVSEPVLTIFGYHLIKVEKIYPPMEMKPKRVQVRHILIRFPGDPRRDAERLKSDSTVELVDSKYCKKLASYCEKG
jgi:parvulin-like peptidyl-prolyl isomerase